MISIPLNSMCSLNTDESTLSIHDRDLPFPLLCSVSITSLHYIYELTSLSVMCRDLRFAQEPSQRLAEFSICDIMLDLKKNWILEVFG